MLNLFLKVSPNPLRAARLRSCWPRKPQPVRVSSKLWFTVLLRKTSPHRNKSFCHFSILPALPANVYKYLQPSEVLNLVLKVSPSPLRAARFSFLSAPKTLTRASAIAFQSCGLRRRFEDPLRIEINLSAVSQSFPPSPLMSTQMSSCEVERRFSRCWAHQLRAYLK